MPTYPTINPQIPVQADMANLKEDGTYEYWELRKALYGLKQAASVNSRASWMLLPTYYTKEGEKKLRTGLG